MHDTVFGYFAEHISKEDISKFGFVIGNPKYQAVLENLALLVAVRTWAPVWTKERLAVCLRSDSMATVGAWSKQRSSNAAINMITRELSLDLAEGKYTVDRVEHFPGALNTWADLLSRLYQPGAGGDIPSALKASTRYFPSRWHSRWWQLELRPSDRVAAAEADSSG